MWASFKDSWNDKTNVERWLAQSEPDDNYGDLWSVFGIQNIEKTKYLTLPETNITLENKPSQKEIPLPTIDFQVLC